MKPVSSTDARRYTQRSILLTVIVLFSLACRPFPTRDVKEKPAPPPACTDCFLTIHDDAPLSWTVYQPQDLVFIGPLEDQFKNFCYGQECRSAAQVERWLVRQVCSTTERNPLLPVIGMPFDNEPADLHFEDDGTSVQSFDQQFPTVWYGPYCVATSRLLTFLQEKPL